MKYSLLASAVVLGLVGCGSDNSSESQTTQISGVAISSEGALAAAKVCLADGLFAQCSDALSTTTNEQGQFTIAVDKSQYAAMVAPVITVVPGLSTKTVGEVVTYQAFSSSSVISPLTTKVVDQVRIDDPAVVTESIITQTQALVADNMNLSSTDVNSNYIESGDAKVLSVATTADKALVEQAELTKEFKEDLEAGCTGQAVVNYQYDYNHHLAELVFVKSEGSITKCDQDGNNYTTFTEEKWRANTETLETESEGFNWYTETKTWLTDNQQQISTLWKFDYDANVQGYDFIGEKFSRLTYSTDRMTSKGYAVYDEDGWIGWGHTHRGYDCSENTLQAQLEIVESDDAGTINVCVDFVEYSDYHCGETTKEKVQFFDPIVAEDRLSHYWPARDFTQPNYYEERESHFELDGSTSFLKQKDWGAKTFNALELAQAPFNEVELNISHADGTATREQHSPNWPGVEASLNFGSTYSLDLDSVNPFYWKFSTEKYSVRSAVTQVDGREVTTEQSYQNDKRQVATKDGAQITTDLPYINEQGQLAVIMAQEIAVDAQQSELVASVQYHPIEMDIVDVVPAQSFLPSQNYDIDYVITGMGEAELFADMQVTINDNLYHRKVFTNNVFDAQLTWNVAAQLPQIADSVSLEQQQLFDVLASVFTTDGDFSFANTTVYDGLQSCSFGYRDYLTSVTASQMKLTFEQAGDLYVDIACNTDGTQEYTTEDRTISAVLEIISLEQDGTVDAQLTAWDYGDNIYLDEPLFIQELSLKANSNQY